jgi:hypothetical protein
VWIDSWLSIAGAGCGLTRVGAGEEQARKVVASEAPGVEKTSRLRSRDPLAAGQVRTAWWHEQQHEVVDGFLVEPQNQGRAGTTWSQVMSGDWRRLYRVRGVCSGSLENHWVTRLSHKTEAEDSTRR